MPEIEAMSPRPGGETDKVGNRYEGAWIVSHLLHVLAGRGKSITVEALGELSDGAEFVFTRADGVVEAHQLKRQHGTTNNWSVKSLHGLGVWSSAKQHVDAGREYHFVSTIPAANLSELCDRARRSASLDDFVKNWLTKPLREAFNELSAATIYGSPLTAWTTLRGIWLQTQDERALVNSNAALSGVLLDGAAGALSSVGLGDLALNNLGVTLDASTIEAKLGTYDLKLAGQVRRATLAQGVNTVTVHWRASVERELLSPPITRAETDVLAEAATIGTSAVVLLVGTAGGGKSAVLAQAVDKIEAADVTVLGFRLDRLTEFANTSDLGDKLGLGASPVAALATAAAGRPSVLVVDQLDAVSLASGRMPRSFGAVEDLIREAIAFPEMHVVLVCRQFDVDNDYRIRTLSSALKPQTISVSALSDHDVDAAVTAMGLDPSKLIHAQRQLLKLPLHLVLLENVADQPDALDFQTTAHLFDAYWRRKRQMIRDRKSSVRFDTVIAKVATAISNLQRLSVSDAVLDTDDLAEDGDVLVSEHVLVRDENQIAFFHEAFFDYAFARQWATGNQTLIEFLTSAEQELFRRGQVRQILHHLRQRDSPRYIAEMSSALSSNQVRFHIKEAVLAVLGGLSDPTSAELQAVVEAAKQQDTVLAGRIWQMMRTPAWFDRLDTDGTLRTWLDHGTEEEQNRAVDILATAARTNPDRVAAILATRKNRSEYHAWLCWIVRFADVHTSRALFDLCIEGVRADAFKGREGELWLSTHNLADHNAAWAIELVRAYFVDRPDALSLNEAGEVESLVAREHSAADMIRKAASAEPRMFVESLLPYMKRVMELAVGTEKGPGFPTDRHFSYFMDQQLESSQIDDALIIAMRGAIEAVVRDDAACAKPILEDLAATKRRSAQWLLYHGLIVSGATHAEWSADLLLEEIARLFCGDLSNSVWVARQLIEVIAPHIDDARHQAIEVAVIDLRFEWESRQGAGWYAFNLLSALDETRLTELGRRRLGEYRRKFKVEEPPEPEGVRGGVIESPIAGDAISHMTDDNWLQAMARHDADQTNWTTFKGGARELAHVLQQQTKADPARFAKLARRFTSETNSSYSDAILLGLGEASVDPDDEGLIFDAIRHIASLGHSDTDRWLAHPLRTLLKTVPLDLVELIRDRALSASDPIADSTSAGSEREPGENLRSAGMNSARGNLAEELGDLLVYDADGTRTAAVVPALPGLATDPVISVRSQAAHTVSAALRYARSAAIDAFWQLIDTDDEVLTGRFVRRLMMYIGNGGEQATIVPVINRMIHSDNSDVRLCGGELAAFAALEWDLLEPLDQVIATGDERSRKGVAQMCAAQLSACRNPALAASTLVHLFDDSDADVREAAAHVAANLRGEALGPFEGVIMALLESPAFEPATPQLFITLEHAPDKVDVLVLRCAQRFIEVFGAAAGDMRTGAAGHAHYVCDLVIRALAQSQDREERAALLDVVDELIKVGAYGVDQAIGNAER